MTLAVCLGGGYDVLFVTIVFRHLQLDLMPHYRLATLAVHKESCHLLAVALHESDILYFQLHLIDDGVERPVTGGYQKIMSLRHGRYGKEELAHQIVVTVADR